LDALGINLGYFLVQVINFLIILVILRAWAYKPLMKVLKERRERIAKGLEDARIAAEARENAEAQAQKIIADAQAEASEVVRNATQRAEEATKDIRTAAEADAKKMRDEALAGVEQERERILSDVRGQIAALAMAATQKLVGATLDDKKQRALIDEFFSGIKGGKVVVVDSASSEAAVVTSALPLTDAEKQEVAKTLKGVVTYKVDPSILGGLVVRVGDKVLDGSVAGKMEGMRQSLN
jgi:F-type H+-transporting ATPase subunit b